MLSNLEREGQCPTCKAEMLPSAALQTTDPAHDLGISTVIQERSMTIEKAELMVRKLQGAINRIAELERLCQDTPKPKVMAGFQPASTLLVKPEPPIDPEIKRLQSENETLKVLLEASLCAEEKKSKELTVLKSQGSSPVQVLQENLKRRGSELPTPSKLAKIQLPKTSR